VRDQVSHPCTTTGKLQFCIFLCLFFYIWEGKRKYFGLNDSKHCLNLICSSFDHECHSDLSVWSPSISRSISCPHILALCH
jgi:hypothetical protein